MISRYTGLRIDQSRMACLARSRAPSARILAPRIRTWARAIATSALAQRTDIAQHEHQVRKVPTAVIPQPRR